MTPNYVIVIENTRYNQSKLGETRNPSVFLSTVGREEKYRKARNKWINLQL